MNCFVRCLIIVFCGFTRIVSTQCSEVSLTEKLRLNEKTIAQYISEASGVTIYLDHCRFMDVAICH